MNRTIFSALICFTCVSYASAQRGGQEWMTSGADAQRSSWIRTDPKIFRDSMQKPGFKFLWKLKLDNEAKQLNSLTQPVQLDRLIGYRGFESLAFVGGSSDALYAIDYDNGLVYWKTDFKSAAPRQTGSLACPGGLTAAATRPVNLLPPTPGRGGGGGGITSARSMVGLPDQGFPDILGRGPTLPPPPPTPAAAAPAAPAAQPPRGGGQVNVASVYALAGDGKLHQLSLQTGRDVVMQPLQLLPPNARASGLLLVNNVLYTATSNDCGGAANAVWAVDLGSPDKTITSWKTMGANIAGSAALALGTDGTVYAATTDGTVVALQPKTLQLKDSFSVLNTEFMTSPLVFQHGGKDLIAAAGKDGRIFILNSTSLGGADHRTPLSVTPSGATSDSLASWQDTDGTRWILGATSTAVTAFKLVEQNGIPMLQPSWVSREMVSPLPPIIINGVIFALSSGEYRDSAPITTAQRAQRSKPAVLYALDGLTGKELWNSGATITSFAHNGGLAGGFGQVFVSSYDSTFYSFGFPIEK